MSDNGWIAIHRKIRENWIWKDPEKLRAWLDILLMVNHEEKTIPYNGKMITIYPGQRLTSIYQLADRWGWSKHRVYRFLALLKADKMCTTDGTTGGTIITVVNWGFYQTKPNTDGTTNGTTGGTTNGTQTTMINNDKQHRRVKNESDIAYEEFLKEQEELERKERENDCK